MNYLFRINKDLLIHHIFIYLNSYDIMNIKKVCSKYFYLIENNKLYIYNLILSNHSKIFFKELNKNYCFFYSNKYTKQNYGFNICSDINLEKSIHQFNIMMKHHNYDVIV